jgi:hypothetical protein
MSVRLSAYINAAVTGRISVKFDSVDFYENPAKNFQNLVKNGQEYRALYMKIYKCFIVVSNTKSLQNGSLRVTGYQAVRIAKEAQTLGERVSCLWFI